jgi:hypothetical protein
MTKIKSHTNLGAIIDFFQQNIYNFLHHWIINSHINLEFLLIEFIEPYIVM